MQKNMYEIYLTSDFVEEKEWLKFIFKVSKINGLFRTWNLLIFIENNYVRYFIETNRNMPPILSDLGDFLIKKTDLKSETKFKKGMIYILTKKYNNILEVYDRNETKKSQKLEKIKITFFPYKYNNYFSITHFYLKNKVGNLIKRFVLGNPLAYKFISVNFGKHIRFFYKKNEAKYLDTKKVLNILSSDKENALLKADVFPYLQDNLYLKHSNFDFNKHSIVIGASGTGKSKLISLMIKNLSKNHIDKTKYKIVVIDPHCSMEDDIGGLDDTKVIDYKREESSVNLFINSSKDILSTTESMITIFKNIIADKYNSKLERVLRYSIHILLENRKFNLVNLRKLLTEIEFRNELIRECENYVQPNIIEFFRVDFNELKVKSYQEAISPIISFIDEMQLLPAFNSVLETNTIEDVINENFITIFSLDQITLGLNITKTIAGFVMQSILQLVQAHKFDEHIIFVIDEVAIIENPIINRFLSEARKYNLSMILAGQYFEQISKELQKAIFTNVVNYFIFRVSKSDAILLEGNMQMEMAVKNSMLSKIKMITELNDRECIVKIGKDGRTLSSFKARTMDFTPVPRKKIPYKETIIIKKNNEKEHTGKNLFNIESKNTLKDIMKKQSTSRRKVNFET